MNYKINYTKLIQLLTPQWLRRPAMLAWLWCIVCPVFWLYEKFITARANDLFVESIDSTIPRLEYMLNYVFYEDGLNTAYHYRIVIDKFPAQNALHIFLGGIMQETDEGAPVWIADETEPVYIFTDNETDEIGVDFIVKVPAAVVFDMDYMRSMVRSFALPDKTFEIVTYKIK